MTGKQITDLASTDSCSDGDLMLVRKSSLGADRKITYADFVESVGNSAVSGCYIAVLDEEKTNKIVLKAVNHASTSKYYEGMRISFKAPAKTNGTVHVKIGDLEYKNLYKHKSNITVSLEKDDYVEALFTDGYFQQINDLKTIIEKQVVDIDRVGSFNQDDVLLLRKSGTSENKKIVYNDFIKSIGSRAITGFLPALDQEQSNKIILKAANNSYIPKYCEGMRISFVSPAKTNGSVQVRVGDLQYKNLYRYSSNVTVSLEKDDYIEALLIGEHFQQINDLKTVSHVYTNDYICVTHKIDKNGLLTELTLNTAYGFRKHEYYNGMSINFMCPVDTKGAVRVNIDGLGAKEIIEGDVEDFLYEPLYNGQIVQAIFNGVCFVKNKFQVEDPKIRQSLEPCPILSTEEKPQAVTPIDNILEYNIGSGLIGDDTHYHFPTLRAALEEILNKYPDNSGRLVTLNILSTLTASKDSVVIKGRDLSWITIKGNEKNKIDIFYDTPQNSYVFFSLTSCTNFNFAKDTVIFYNFQLLSSVYYFFHLIDCNFSFKDVILDFMGFETGSTHLSRGSAPRSFMVEGGNINMDNVISKAAIGHLYLHGSKKSIVSLTNCKFNNYGQHTHNVTIDAPNSELTITNCDLSRNGTSNIDDIYIMKFATVTQINSRAKVRYQGSNGTCAPNITDAYARYMVIGSQDEVGNDN